MTPAALAPRPDSGRQRPQGATVRVFNETPWVVHVAVRDRAARGVIAPGEDATLSLPLASDRALSISCHGHHLVYALDFDLLGFDTVHVRAADLMPVATR